MGRKHHSQKLRGGTTVRRHSRICADDTPLLQLSQIAPNSYARVPRVLRLWRPLVNRTFFSSKSDCSAQRPGILNLARHGTLLSVDPQDDDCAYLHQVTPRLRQTRDRLARNLALARLAAQLPEDLGHLHQASSSDGLPTPNSHPMGTRACCRCALSHLPR